MIRYVITRIGAMIPTLVLASIVIFTIIQLPPGDYVETYIGELLASGESVDLQRAEYLRQEYGLNKPMWQRYLLWIGNFVTGDFGYSFEYQRPVSEVVGNSLFFTILLSFFTIILTWVVAFPIGIYSATHQYSWGDYGLTFLGLLGMATPNFLLALIMMYLLRTWFGTSIGGLMDAHFIDQPMSWPKFWSIMEHLIVPTIVIGTSGTAAMIRRIRANLLDELQKQYVVTARAKGVPPFKALVKYPLRMSLNFFIADIGSLLPSIISGAEIVSIVLSLPTTGPLLIAALKSQDMYLAGSFLMFVATLTVIGVLVSDIALGFLDPRIRLGAEAER